VYTVAQETTLECRTLRAGLVLLLLLLAVRLRCWDLRCSASEAYANNGRILSDLVVNSSDCAERVTIVPPLKGSLLLLGSVKCTTSLVFLLSGVQHLNKALRRIIQSILTIAIE
jgi:hypothetical protein